jgi:DNA-binding NarL/FixJ family response regulator
MDKTRIIIADDHQIVIDGIRALIGKNPNFKIIGEARNGKEVLELLKYLHADVILMDLDMPVMNGLDTTEAVKKKNSKCKVIGLTMHSEPGMIRAMMESGADGYVLKTADREMLFEAIDKVLMNQKYFSPEVTETLVRNNAQMGSSNNTESEKLTDREEEILILIAEGFSNKEIGEKLFISHRTVDTHRTNIMKKIDARNIAGVIRYAIKNGYLR